MRCHDLNPRIVASVLAAVSLLAVSPAQATLIGDLVEITLASPNDNFFNSPLTDNNITVGAGNEIQTGDTTNIGSSGVTLPYEFLDIQADRITLQLESGAEVNGNLTTGFAPGAYWMIAGLDFAGGTITGFDLFLTGISNFGLGNITFSGGDTFQIFISDLWIADNTTCDSFSDEDCFDVGQIELRLLTDGTPPPPPPVPEPGTLALLALGLGALAGTRRRRPC